MDHDQTSMFVRRAVSGEQDGVEWIVAHFHPFVEAQVRMRLRGKGGQQDVEDLAADVWLVTLRNLANLQPQAGRLAPVLVKFLGTTVLQTCNNFLRTCVRNARSGAGAGPQRQPTDPDDIPADTLGVVTRVVQRDLGSVVGECLDNLASDKRDVLVLRLMEHRTNQEIGRLLGIEPNTVAVRYRRALDELKARLPGDVFDEIRAAAG